MFLIFGVTKATVDNRQDVENIDEFIIYQFLSILAHT